MKAKSPFQHTLPPPPHVQFYVPVYSGYYWPHCRV